LPAPFGKSDQLAGYNPAIQQIANLRYFQLRVMALLDPDKVAAYVNVLMKAGKVFRFVDEYQNGRKSFPLIV